MERWAYVALMITQQIKTTVMQPDDQDSRIPSAEMADILEYHVNTDSNGSQQIEILNSC